MTLRRTLWHHVQTAALLGFVLLWWCAALALLIGNWLHVRRRAWRARR